MSAFVTFYYTCNNGYIFISTGFDEFFDFLKTGKILENQEIFRCELENLLENDKEQL